MHFTHSFNKHFLSPPVGTRHCSRPWGCGREQNQCGGGGKWGSPGYILKVELTGRAGQGIYTHMRAHAHTQTPAHGRREKGEEEKKEKEKEKEKLSSLFSPSPPL